GRGSSPALLVSRGTEPTRPNIGSVCPTPGIGVMYSLLPPSSEVESKGSPPRSATRKMNSKEEFFRKKHSSGFIQNHPVSLFLVAETRNRQKRHSEVAP